MANSSQVIQKTANSILIVIDTMTIKNNYPAAAIDTEKPVKIDRVNWFSVSQEKEYINAVPTAFVNSKKNDKITIAGISIDGDSSDAIILNKIKNYSSIKKNIVSFEAICLSRKTISKDQNSEDDLSVSNTEQNFIWFESLISHPGKIRVKIYFSLYYLNSDGNQQDFYGRFWFPLEIMVY